MGRWHRGAGYTEFDPDGENDDSEFSWETVTKPPFCAPCVIGAVVASWGFVGAVVAALYFAIWG